MAARPPQPGAAGAALARRLPGRRAFVTGGGSGLGLAFATELARAGWTLGLLDREPARLAAAAEQLRAAGAPAVHPYVADVTDEAAFTAAVDAFAAQAAGLDLMINNAGVAAAGSVDETPLADWQWAFGINVYGVVIGTRAALRVMRLQGSGHVLNVASAAGFASGPRMSAYNASKAAVVSLTETLIQEFELEGAPLRATVAMPGFFPTKLLDDARAPEDAMRSARRLMHGSTYTAERAAFEILSACARGDSYVVVPDQYRLLWRLKRFSPAWFLRWLPKQRGRATKTGR
jgi:NAD(P)-dependent dehydrogenase (short-subunit alcohol dehydrogenase family)